MKIVGWNKTTLLDYPEHIATTLFTSGCNFRCPFCHNPSLVLGEVSNVVTPSENGINIISKDEIFSHLKKRIGIIDGVCITGGEPTLQSDLMDFIGEIKALKYKVKLDTNGYRPEILEQLLSQKLLDYVAMDIKASKEQYAAACGMDSKFQLENIEKSVELLKRSAVAYEFRTTFVKGIHSLGEVAEIAKWLKGCQAYYLQQFREGELLAKNNNFEEFSLTEMEEMQEICKKYIPNTFLRGAE